MVVIDGETIGVKGRRVRVSAGGTAPHTFDPSTRDAGQPSLCSVSSRMVRAM